MNVKTEINDKDKVEDKKKDEKVADKNEMSDEAKEQISKIVKVVGAVVDEKLKPYNEAMRKQAEKIQAIDNVLVELGPLIKEYKNYQQKSQGQETVPGNGEATGGQPNMGGIQVISDILKTLGITKAEQTGDQTLQQFFMKMGMDSFQNMNKLYNAIGESIVQRGVGMPTAQDIARPVKKLVERELE